MIFIAWCDSFDNSFAVIAIFLRKSLNRGPLCLNNLMDEIPRNIASKIANLIRQWVFMFESWCFSTLNMKEYCKFLKLIFLNSTPFDSILTLKFDIFDVSVSKEVKNESSLSLSLRTGSTNKKWTCAYQQNVTAAITQVKQKGPWLRHRYGDIKAVTCSLKGVASREIGINRHNFSRKKRCPDSIFLSGSSLASTIFTLSETKVVAAIR